MPLKIDLTKKNKQSEYYRAVMDACAGINDYRYFAYGGAICFNVNPMCCPVIQCYNNCIGVMEVIKLPNSGTEALCRYIRASPYWGCNLRVTGDACNELNR